MKSTPSIMKHMTLSRQKSPLKEADPGKGQVLNGMKHMAKGIVKGAIGAVTANPELVVKGAKKVASALSDNNTQEVRQPRFIESKEKMITKELKKLPQKERMITKSLKSLPAKGRKEGKADSVKEDDSIITEDDVKVNLRNK